MTIDKIHDLIDDISNAKEQGKLTHAQKDQFLNQAQFEILNELVPAYGVGQKLHDYLLPFRKKMTLINGNTASGAITLPTDYLHLLAIELNVVEDGTTVYKPVEMVNTDEVSFRKNSQLIPASRYPFGYYDAQGIQLHPASAVAGTLWYLKKPAQCVYAYTQSGRTITYDSAGSTQLEWNDEATNKIIMRALQLAGMNLKDVNLTQFATAKGGLN